MLFYSLDRIYDWLKDRKVGFTFTAADCLQAVGGGKNFSISRNTFNRVMKTYFKGYIQIEEHKRTRKYKLTHATPVPRKDYNKLKKEKQLLEKEVERLNRKVKKLELKLEYWKARQRNEKRREESLITLMEEDNWT